jgi:hypothetical protein
MSLFRRLTLTTKLTLLFVLFAVLILAGVGALIYVSGRPALEQAVISDLRSTANEKQAAFDAWLDDRLKLAVSITEFPSDRARVNSLIDDNLDDAARKSLHELSRQALSGFTGPNSNYTEIMIIQARDGQVIVSTNTDEEGKFVEDRPYFIEGSKGPFVQSIFYSLGLQAPSMVVSAPIRADDGRVIAVLAAPLKLEQMNEIILRRTSEHTTEDAFLVNPANLFVTQPRFISDPAVLQRGNFTPLVNRCLGGESGTASDLDYRSLPVIAVYRWLPARQLCLVVQVDQAEAFAPAAAFRATLLTISGIGLLVGSALAIALARTITNPLRALRRSYMPGSTCPTWGLG